MEEEFEEFEEHPQDVMEQYQDYPYAVSYTHLTLPTILRV